MESIVAFAARLAEAEDDPDWREREILQAPFVSKTAGAQTWWDDANDCRRTKAIFVELREATEAIQPAMRSEAISRLVPHAQRFVLEREEERRREGLADFDDLLVWARNLLLTSPEARAYFRRRFRVLLVDEFQDTDPVQAEIAVLIASDDDPADGVLELTPRPGGLTVVGDPKQSIYRFRGADIAVYDAVRNGPLAGDDPQLVQNFRSTTASSTGSTRSSTAFSSRHRACSRRTRRSSRPAAGSSTSPARSACSAPSPPTRPTRRVRTRPA